LEESSGKLHDGCSIAPAQVSKHSYGNRLSFKLAHPLAAIIAVPQEIREVLYEQIGCTVSLLKVEHSLWEALKGFDDEIRRYSNDHGTPGFVPVHSMRLTRRSNADLPGGN
jgi:hypothetical protein